MKVFSKVFSVFEFDFGFDAVVAVVNEVDEIRHGQKYLTEIKIMAKEMDELHSSNEVTGDTDYEVEWQDAAL